MTLLTRPSLTAAQAERVPMRGTALLAGLWAAFWLLMIWASAQDALRNPAIAWWEPVLWEGSSVVVATGWAWLALRARDRYAPYLEHPLTWFGRYLRWLPLADITFVVAVYAIRHGVYAAMGRPYEHAGWMFVFIYESVKLCLFAGLWLGILFGMDSYGQWRHQRQGLLEAQRALAEAQLVQLQGQLRPHFLFNALNTVSALMHTDVARADRLVATLGDLLRASLRTVGTEMMPLREELRLLALYADVMGERFRDRVVVAWDVDEAVGHVPVPALLLQPLLENVFKHGVERTIGTVTVVIEVRGIDNPAGVEVSVSNSGVTLWPGHRDGLGLRNCRERLRILYGDRASLAVVDEDDGVVARVRLPLAERVA
ncbi:sensor histidine kinase [Luteibacter yeojuensis]|uniref:Histidine kinase n=1 Tax=Luteibacter yeojuensis TaxID=345309 RepID=A0A7X5QXH8_9GAMM|nr:histidine kinase [Luteibacter yeojuensis]NID17243.1 histidine kinase [Luteibacter yeojuensis]